MRPLLPRRYWPQQPTLPPAVPPRSPNRRRHPPARCARHSPRQRLRAPPLSPASLYPSLRARRLSCGNSMSRRTMRSPSCMRQMSPLQDVPPPIVREIDVTTQDVPLAALKNAIPAQAPADTAPPAVDETINAPPPILGPAVPSTPNVVTETTPIPTIVPPPVPPLPARRAPSLAEPPRSASQDEPTKARAGFARVAVARQAGQHPDPPSAPQSPAPLQPPLPTGPRVHACPTCGYPVRDHARYCPNCGTRQRP